MDENNNQPNDRQNSGPEGNNGGKRDIGQILTSLAVVVLMLVTLFGGGSCLFGGNAKKSAEKYVGQQVYQTYGAICDRYQTEVLYSHNGDKLVVVNFYLDGSHSADGSYCVCCINGSACNSTGLMPAYYSYKGELDSLKVIFGI